MKWKKEGYIVGDEICIVKSFYPYRSDKKVLKGVVEYVGLKILKVSLDTGELLKFKGSRFMHGGFSDPSYAVYISEKEYNNHLIRNKEIDDLKEFIQTNLNKIEYEKLKEIENIIKR